VVWLQGHATHHAAGHAQKEGATGAAFLVASHRAAAAETEAVIGIVLPDEFAIEGRQVVRVEAFARKCFLAGHGRAPLGVGWGWTWSMHRDLLPPHTAFSATFAPMTAEEKIQVLLAHPDESPEIVGTLPYLIHPPGRLSSTARWVEFRDKTLLPAIEARPDDVNLPRFLEQTEKILAWRATIAPERHIWKADKPRGH
jgi:hypothetical protein